MTPLERLRLAVALGHTAPAAELRLRTVDGDAVVVAGHHTADIDPCAMRRIVQSGACARGVDCSGRVAEVTVGGSLEDLGAGVYRLARRGVEQRWIASLLEPHRIAAVLDGVGVDGVPHDAVHACLEPDPDLGVTVLVIASPDARYRHHLDEYAAQAAAACYVEELRQCIDDSAGELDAAVDRRRSVDSPDERRRDREVS